MGRTIRRVPPTWRHPIDARGRHVPLCDETYLDALNGYRKRREEWSLPENAEKRAKWSFEEYEGDPPSEDYYRPAWPEGSDTAFQVYENVSEGTPVSPVFATREALIDWLVNDGSGMGIGGVPTRLSRPAAERFVDAGYAPSMICIPGVGALPGVQAYERAAPPDTKADAEKGD